MSFFETNDYSDSTSKKVVSRTVDYYNSTDLSNFPMAIDDLKEIDFSATSLEEIEDDLDRYYELLDTYINSSGEDFDPHVDEFKDLYEGLSKFQLTSEDYMIMRDSIMSLIGYLQSFVEEEVYGEEGVITELRQQVQNFEKQWNESLDSMNKEYNKLENGPIGKIIPSKAIGAGLLNEHLKEIVRSIESSQGIVVVRPGDNMPNAQEAGAPAVIKVVA